jgi:hypothetical protein
MTPELPKAITAYIEGSNAHDADACAPCFADDAVVRDEGRESSCCSLRAFSSHGS